MKTLLIDEFGKKLTLVEAERMLRARKWNRQASMHHYILELENLRMHVNIDRFTEVEFVDLVIDGI